MESTVAKKSAPQEQWLTGWCAMCLQPDCGMRIHLRDGVVVETIGDPDSPVNKGKLCMRGGLGAIPGYYDPKRIKGPMRRTNPRKGLDQDPAWESISWDEALSIVGTKLRELRADDPRKLIFIEGWGVCDEILVRESWLKIPGHDAPTPGNTFTLAFGTPNLVASHGVLCPIHFATNLVHGHYPEQIADLQHCNYLIAPGRTVGSNTGCPPAVERLEKALSRGMKLVVVDPRHSAEAAKAHRWLPIRPGTELAFALGMVHGIIHELKTWDDWFLTSRTNAPYLIGPDGLYARDPASGKPLMWDAKLDAARPFDEVESPVLDGAFTINGVSVSTGFRLVSEQTRAYTPEWAEEITSIPAADLRAVTREFVAHAQIGATIKIDGFEFPLRPAQFGGSGRGAVSHQNGSHFDLTCKLVNLLVGAVEVPGGITGGMRPGPNASILQPNEDGVVTPVFEAIPHHFVFPPDNVDGAEFFPHKHSTPQITVRNILNPERYHVPYQADMVIAAGANLLRGVGDVDLWTEALNKVSMVVAIASSLEETVTMADIVLPVSHFLEKEGLRIFRPPMQSIDDDLRGLQMIQARQTVPRLHNTRNCDQILYDLAEAGGFLREMNDWINKTCRLSKGNQLPLEGKHSLEMLWDRMVAENWDKKSAFADIRAVGRMHRQRVTGKEAWNYYYWPGNKTRHPFYFDRLPKTAAMLREAFARHGITHPGYQDQEAEFFAHYTGVPHWFPSRAQQEAPAQYDLYAMHWKTIFRIHGTGGNMGNPWLNEMREMDPYELYIHINPKAAKQRGLRDGQAVIVESPAGSTRGILRVTELIHPEVIGFPGNYGGVHASWLNPVMPKQGAWFNALLDARESLSVDPISGGIEIAPRVRVLAADKKA